MLLVSDHPHLFQRWHLMIFYKQISKVKVIYIIYQYVLTLTLHLFLLWEWLLPLIQNLVVTRNIVGDAPPPLCLDNQNYIITNKTKIFIVTLKCLPVNSNQTRIIKLLFIIYVFPSKLLCLLGNITKAARQNGAFFSTLQLSCNPAKCSSKQIINLF